MHIKAVLTTLAGMTPQTPAGWYPDPYGSPQLRWWDGSQWTDATHPLEQAAADPVSAQGPQDVPPAAEPSGPQLTPGPQFVPGPGTGPYGAQAAHPSNPTQQYGYSQSPWGGPLPGPEYGQPPKRSGALPWVLGGVGALLVVALIVGAVFFVVNASSRTVALPSPVATETQQQPEESQPPQETVTELPAAKDGVVTDPLTGLSYAVPEGWAVPGAASEINGTDPSLQAWTSGVEKTSQANYDGKDGDWIGNVYTGLLNQVYPYEGVSGLSATTQTVFIDFATNYYQLPNTRKILQNKALKVGDRDAWLLEFELDFTKESEEKGYKWKKERGAIVVMDRGEGETPALLYVSVPDNLGTDVVSQVLNSLKVS